MRLTTPSRLGLSALGLLSLLATSCDSLGPERSELERARALWEATGPSDYSYAVERLCFCGYTGPARVTVEDGEVVSVVSLTEQQPPIEPSEDLFPSVDGLFDILEDAMARDAHSITATYDPETGVPVEFFIDYQEFTVDEELGMRVTEGVTPLEP
ncbi:MAG: DUF6174 domain-containing protein [Gemmatimonadota bacterium]